MQLIIIYVDIIIYQNRYFLFIYIVLFLKGVDIFLAVVLLFRIDF